jgi:transcriptional regulator with XRE-family HTH domain
MPLRDPLAAVIHLVRLARGLTREDFQGQLDATHVFKLENSRSSVTLDTLEMLATTLDVHPLALLVVAASFEAHQSPEDFLKYLNKETKKLKDLGIVEELPTQFKDGVLIPRKPGKRTAKEKVDAVLRCRADGMTQKQASDTVGLPTSTVNRIWWRSQE